MQIVLAGASAAELLPIVEQQHGCLVVEEPLLPGDIPPGSDLLVSFGYRHIVSAEILAAFRGNAINLHISLLPWNRGADPNLWSWLEGTPKGVSIHWMVPEVDRGEIVGQRRVHIDLDMTLRSSYDLLHGEILELFVDLWPHIERGDAPRTRQPAGGTYHRSKDKNRHLAALTDGWDTRCGDVAEYGRRTGLTISAGFTGDE